MHLDIKGLGVEVTDAIADHTQKRFTAALNQHSNRVADVQITLKDANGPKGGVDKQCDVQIKLNPHGDIVVKEANTDLYTAISLAADRIKNAVGRKLDRRKDKRQ